MTEIAAQLATTVRETKPNQNDWYKTAQDRLRVARLAGPDVKDSDSYLRWKVNVPRRQEIASLFLDVFFEADSGIGGGILLAQLMKVNGPTYRQMTWNKVPGVVPGVPELEGEVSGRRVRFDITDYYDALTLEDGSVSPWLSYRLRRRNDGGTTWLVGPNRGRYAPRLVMTTQPREFDPTDLRPAGIVGRVKPVVQWTAPLEITTYQVQVDELAGDFTSPLYDSGQLPAAGQVRNVMTHATTTGPTWAGIPVDGASWRVRHRTVTGWSEYVEAEVSYIAKGAPVLLNPDASDADPTPPIAWDLPADSFQVVVTRGNKVVEETPIEPGPATSYTPKRGAVTPGETVRREVRWFDEHDRVTSPGDPPWVLLSQDTVFEPSEAVPPMDSLTVHQDGETPLVIATAARGDLPDEAWFGWGEEPGTLIPGTEGLTFRDWTVPPNTNLPYATRAVVNGEHSAVERTTEIRTSVGGMWLVDPESERGFVLAGLGLEIASEEVVVVNSPISAAALIRRTLMLRDEAGTMTGELTDWPGRTLEQQRADALWLRERPERELQLIGGDLSIPVFANIGKPRFDPATSFTDRIRHTISFAFSHAGNED